MSNRSAGQTPSRLIAVLGPTNTGKTHYAVERMLGHASGMIGLPLRLLAREVYDRIVRLRGARSVALITGEEKILPPRAVYFVCTVEAMPMSREVEFLAVDEIQLMADPERGHIFTQRLLHARGRFETLFLGSAIAAPLIRRLLPEAEFIHRERFSELRYDGSKKLTRLPRRSAVVAFSADRVYAIAELIRRQRGGAAVVMGSLSPRTRNAQVALYQSGEVDFLVATDAIGMGLNMDVDHVAFAGLRKFDGKRTRWLTPQEIGQIAGRAGRYRKDGTFGVTGEAEEIDPDLVEAVESHTYEPLIAAEWRTAALDFANLNDLLCSLATPPLREGLKLAPESLDETVLRALSRDEDITRKVRDRSALLALWDACQTPDFRKTTLDEHLHLVRLIFRHLTDRSRRLPADWMAEQLKALDRTDGEIDALAQRLSGVRTLAYAANRPNWLADPAHWQGRCRTLEDRLSDTLHEKLMQRFIDRRTSALMRGLASREDLSAGLAADGQVTVEGHLVGRLEGLRFEGETAGSALEDKALRQAAQRAVGPEIARRLGKLAAEPGDAFGVSPDGQIFWRGELAAQVIGGDPFRPKVRLFGELGPAHARERAKRRLEAFIAKEAGNRLSVLRHLDEAITHGRLAGLARGLAFRMLEGGGVLPRVMAGAEIAALSPAERRALKALGVKFGAFCLFAPTLLEDDALRFHAMFSEAKSLALDPSGLTRLGDPIPSALALGRRGLIAVSGLAVAVAQLERLDQLLRADGADGPVVTIAPKLAADLSWTEVQLVLVLKGLGFRPLEKVVFGAPSQWRRPRTATARASQKTARPHGPTPSPPASPFAALAALQPVPETPRRTARPRRQRRRARPAAAG